MSPSEKKLDELAKVASRLNEETDNLNQIIQSLEDRLSKMNLGVAVWLDSRLLSAEGPFDYRNDDNEVVFQYMEGYYIGYAKGFEGWRICCQGVQWKLDEDGEHVCDKSSGSYEPLVNASRAVRAEAAAYLDDLLDQLTERAGEYLENIQKAAEAASQS